MVKKVLTLVLGLVLGFGTMAQAPKTAAIVASDVRYWVGSGSNQAVVLITWEELDDNDDEYYVGAVWGVRFNGTILCNSLMDTLSTYDAHLTVSMNSGRSFINDMTYSNPQTGLALNGSGMGWWMYKVNDVMAGAISSQQISNGDFVEWSDMGQFAADTIIILEDPNAPDDPTPTDALIDFADIQYWVGTGTDSAALIVNFGIPDTAFAWGYLFNGSATVQQMTDALAAADPRLTVVGQPSLYPAGDIFFVLENGDTLSLSGRDADNPYNYWEANINGEVSYTGAGQALANGDVFKYGDQRAPSRVCLEEMEYGGVTYCLHSAWTKAPTPVSVPDTTPVVPEVVEATIDFADILYWVGSGANEAVMAVNWADTALAWGYRYDGNKTVADMMDDIAAADPRFSYTTSYGYLDDIIFAVSEGDTLRKQAYSYWESKQNGTMDAGMAQSLSNGAFEKWAEPAAGVVIDSTYWGDDWGWGYTYAYPMTIYPVSVPDTTPEPIVEDATIAASDILFWVGHGNNEAILAVNWADTALAWGYRFSTDSVSSATMMADIAAADPRLTIEGFGFVGDIRYIDTAAGMTDTLAITPGNWWGSLLNGYSDMGTGQILHNGDLQKWGDPVAGVIADSMEWDGYMYYTYVFPMTIHAVTVPDTTGTVDPIDPEHGPFCGAVGTEGCTAIKADSSAIVAWATGVSVTRGPRNIANPDLGLAATGTESNAIGMATLSDVFDVVSLGDSGSALVTFAHPIRNGEGPDFAVYENGFSDNSLELAFVEVSTDGERFVRFPATCLTQTETQLGNAGQTDPTNLNNLAGKYRIGYGTPFDLEQLRDSTGINIDSIVYVRVVDVVGSINPEYGTYDAYGHIINDPWPTPFESSGFDLTGVAVLYENTATTGIADVTAAVEALWPNPATEIINVRLSRAAESVLYDLTGRQVATYSLREGLNTLDLTSLKSGIYMLRTEGSVSKIVKN